MATSGSVNFTTNRDGIIKRSLRQCGAIATGETPNADQLGDASEALNAMVKAWEGLGIHLWTRREATLFLTPSQVSYSLGPGSSDHAAEVSGIARTTLSADEASGQTIIGVASSAGMTAADQVGVVLDDDTFHWTTILTVDSTVQITLAVATTGVAASGNLLYAYTNALNRPLRVIDTRRNDETSDQETPIIMMAHEDYYRLPNKLITGETNEVYYHPTLGDGTIYIWPASTGVSRTLKLTCLLPIEDFDVAADEPDFPQEWINALMWNLASELVPEEGVPDKLANRIEARAGYWLGIASGFDNEPESLFFQPNMTHAHGG